jgi:rhodanese-related sulfurtransferase
VAIGIILFFTGCSQTNEPSETEGNSYRQVSAEEAKRMMDEEENYVILDVRTKEEYDEGHIPGAILIPDFEIESRAEKELTDHDQLILVYCRSGNRSKSASQKLSDLGYSNIVDFGGIINWPYDIDK